MAELKDSFDAISPIPWSSVPLDDLPTYLHEAYAHAEILANSVPVSSPHPNGAPSSTPPTHANTATKGLETFTTGHPTSVDTRNTAIQKHWGKPIKLSAKDNPLHVSVFKTAAQDRHGAWFARRSTHVGLGFTRWRKAMEREFLESLKVQKGPGSGAVRGIAGDKRLEKRIVEGLGKVEVWQLSSAFPGPVTPRGFFSMIVTSDNALSEASSTSEEPSPQNIPRHFIIISRPTTYEDATPNAALVYGKYESVELIREVHENHEDPEMNPVEWIMITRSDPGGGIPKFMVERGTPGSIVADVPKFLDWAIKLGDPPFLDEAEADAEIEKHITNETNHEVAPVAEQVSDEDQTRDTHPTGELDPEMTHPAAHGAAHDATYHGNSSLLGNLTSAVGAMSGYLPHLGYHLPHLPGGFTTGTTTTDNDGAEKEVVEQDKEADTASVSSEASTTTSSSSAGTFASAPELRSQDGGAARRSPTISLDSREIRLQTGAARATNAHERELVKLGEQRAALDARVAKAREEDTRRTQEMHEKEEQETAKAAERREKERNKAEERFKKELEKLEERRQKEVRKAEGARLKEERRAEERQRKAQEKDVVARAQRERDEARAKLDVVVRQNEAMKLQMEELQRQNNSLVQKLGASGEGGMEAVRKVREEFAASVSRNSSRTRSATGSSHKSKDSKDKDKASMAGDLV